MTSKWNPQAAEIIELIRTRLEGARQLLEEYKVNHAVSMARVADLEAILEDAEKSGGPDNA